jgi:hypothetical protein
MHFKIIIIIKYRRRKEGKEELYKIVENFGELFL